MKYKRMLCWVRPHEKKELKEAVNKQFPLVFTKNFNLLKRKMKQNDYVVIACSFVETVYEELKKLVEAFPQNIFIFYDRLENEDFSVYDAKFIFECHKMNITNVIGGLYIAQDMVKNYLDIIPDLEKDLLENYHLEIINENGYRGVKAIHN
jgi:hypothetical protein